MISEITRKLTRSERVEASWQSALRAFGGFMASSNDDNSNDNNSNENNDSNNSNNSSSHNSKTMN